MLARFAVRSLPLALSALLIAAAPSTPTQTAAPALSPNEIVAAAPASDWVDIAPADLLVMDLADPGLSAEAGRDGHARRVVIQLMPPPFSQGWVGNIRKLADAHWWDGTSVNRVQDNYVVQWGDANGDDKVRAKALPGGLAAVPQSSYAFKLEYIGANDPDGRGHFRPAGLVQLLSQRMTRDAYADRTAFYAGWPIAIAGSTKPVARIVDEKGFTALQAWPVHCYAMVGVGRDMPPDTGTGAELYTVIGTPPRHLDRNIALVGRVIAGIEHLSSLPRGTGALGFYEKPEQRVPIVSIRLGSEVASLPRYQYLSTESSSFARYADARANRRDAFFIKPAGGVDICNVAVPIRIRP